MLKSAKVDVAHSAMEIDFQTSVHVVTMEKVAKQNISTKCSICNSFQVISEFIHFKRY